jgi:hypothetical protein
VKDIALFIYSNRISGIRMFIDVKAFDEILRHLRRYKTHNIEFEEIKRLTLEGLQIREKYCDLKSFTNIDGYNVMILSRGRSKACILCKETKEDGWRNIILIKLFTGEPENIGNSIRDDIINKGGYDYEFKG